MKGKTVAILCHVLGFFGALFPFSNIIAPLVLWLAKKDDALVNNHGKEAVNFQISMLIYVIAIGISLFLGFILLSVATADNDSAIILLPSAFLVLVGMIAMVLLIIGELIFVIQACIKAFNGENCRYPLAIRLIK